MKRIFYTCLITILFTHSAISYASNLSAYDSIVISAAEAVTIAQRLNNGEQTAAQYYHITGKVTQIYEIDLTYGNASFFISDGTIELYCDRSFYLDNERFTDTDQLNIGDSITIFAKLYKNRAGYVGASSCFIEFTSRILSFEDNEYRYTILDSDSISIAYINQERTISKLVIPDSIEIEGTKHAIKRIAPFGFSNCTHLKSVIISDNIVVVGADAFAYCDSLTSITIGKGVQQFLMERYCFQGCTHIDTIYWNAINCSDMSSVLFYSTRSNIKSFTFGDQVEHIPSRLCDSLVNIQQITFPRSIRSIGHDVFRDCNNLMHINVVEENPNYASLDGVVYNKELTEIVLCPQGKTSYVVPEYVTSIHDSAFMYCSKLSSVTIPESVVDIGVSAFSYCLSLPSITIPSSVESIGLYALWYCADMQSITVDLSNKNFCSVDGVLFDKNKAVLIKFPCGKGGEYVVPDGVSIIEEGAIARCNQLKSLHFPNSVTTLKKRSVYRNRELRMVNLGKNINLIGDSAFCLCSGIDSIICSSVIPPVLDGNFVFADMARTAVLYVPYESLEAYKAIAGYADFFAEIKSFSNVESITDTTATLKWLPDSAVVQYDINVYTSETHFAQYIVGANGQILSSQRFVPSIYKHKLDTTTSSTEYFTISLDGLSAGTDYTYTIEGTNAESVPIYHEEGTFTTLNEDEEGLFDAVADDPRKQAAKFLHDGVLFIERNDKTYTTSGQEVR